MGVIYGEEGGYSPQSEVLRVQYNEAYGSTGRERDTRVPEETSRYLHVTRSVPNRPSRAGPFQPRAGPVTVVP